MATTLAATSPSPVPSAPGSGHTCALTSRGVWCWGSNEYGKLGINTYEDSYVPEAVQGLPGSVQAVAAGTNHTCALASGRVWCWGYNRLGALGNGSNGSTKDSKVTVPVQGLPKGVTAIATGCYHTCAIANQSVWCWGENAFGQLGDNSTTDRLTPVPVQGLSANARAVTAGTGHTCALVGDGVQCRGWYGLDQRGQGPDPRAIHLLPTAVEGLSTGVQAVVAGSAHTCAVVNGGAQCGGGTTWGNWVTARSQEASSPCLYRA
jgi:alpha-tubulin suppressor-like RCC1 family protein